MCCTRAKRVYYKLMRCRSPRHLGVSRQDAFRLEGSSGTGSVSMYLYAIRDHAPGVAEHTGVGQPPYFPLFTGRGVLALSLIRALQCANAQPCCARMRLRACEFRPLSWHGDGPKAPAVRQARWKRTNGRRSRG